jgi:hypothetical protein
MQIEIISGGQTGVDRAALDAARACGFPHGGWCPRGRRAEDGRIPDHYRLRETRQASYAARTRQNVLDADATLVLHSGVISGGTQYTVEVAQQLQKPLMIVDLRSPPPLSTIIAWILSTKTKRLNVAGPRESTEPGIYRTALQFMRELLSELANTCGSQSRLESDGLRDSPSSVLRE